MPPITESDLINLGFEKIPHYTVTNALIYELGRNRYLSIGCVGTPNEMLWICSRDNLDEKKVTDLICIHNYDYDKYITNDKIKQIINLIEDKNNK